MSQLHSGAEIGRQERSEQFHGKWEAWSAVRRYELENGAVCAVTLFAADVIGISVPHGVTPTGTYRYQVEIWVDGEDTARASTSYVLDNARLVPAMGGESVKLLAWEAALDEADKFLTLITA